MWPARGGCCHVWWAMSSTQAMSAQRAAVITRWWLPAAYAPGGVQARLLLMAVKSCSKRLRAVSESPGREGVPPAEQNAGRAAVLGERSSGCPGDCER